MLDIWHRKTVRRYIIHGISDVPEGSRPAGTAVTIPPGGPTWCLHCCLLSEWIWKDPCLELSTQVPGHVYKQNCLTWWQPTYCVLCGTCYQIVILPVDSYSPDFQLTLLPKGTWIKSVPGLLKELGDSLATRGNICTCRAATYVGQVSYYSIGEWHTVSAKVRPKGRDPLDLIIRENSTDAKTSK